MLKHAHMEARRAHESHQWDWIGVARGRFLEGSQKATRLLWEGQYRWAMKYIVSAGLEMQRCQWLQKADRKAQRQRPYG
jgi:hypothetical protein